MFKQACIDHFFLNNDINIGSKVGGQSSLLPPFSPSPVSDAVVHKMNTVVLVLSHFSHLSPKKLNG